MPILSQLKAETKFTEHKVFEKGDAMEGGGAFFLLCAAAVRPLGLSVWRSVRCYNLFRARQN